MDDSKAVKKVPGEVAKSVTEKQGYFGDLKKLNRAALLELLERQNKLLLSREFIGKLPDKGERIKNLKRRIEDELNERGDVEGLCKVMDGLSVNGKVLNDKLEWQKTKVDDVHRAAKDYDDTESNNPLQIFVNHSGTNFNAKKYRIEKTEEKLITEKDLEEVRDFRLEPYAKDACKKMDTVESKDRFLPFKTLNKELVLKERVIKEITAATPPLPKHGNSKMLSLDESLRLQTEQAKQLRTVQLKHATERLKEKCKIVPNVFLPPPETVSSYRESVQTDSESDGSDQHSLEEKDY